MKAFDAIMYFKWLQIIQKFNGLNFCFIDFRHNDMQIRVDHRTRTVHFGSDLSGAQSYNNMEGPHLQDMPSEQIRQQLMQMLEVLDKSLTTIHPDKIKIENNALRQKIVEAYHASKQRDHQRILRYELV